MYKCMICGKTRTLVKGGKVVLCERCICAIHRALKPKLRRKKRETKQKTA